MKRTAYGFLALHVVVAAMALVAACTTAPQNPAQAVYAAHGTYTVALTAAVKYKQLPPCTAQPAPVCSKPDVVKKLQDADDVAYSALSLAQNLVRTAPPGSTSLQTAIFNATQAVGTFAAAVKALGVSP